MGNARVDQLDRKGLAGRVAGSSSGRGWSTVLAVVLWAGDGGCQLIVRQMPARVLVVQGESPGRDCRRGAASLRMPTC